MTAIVPTIGRIVLYKLAQHDVTAINDQRGPARAGNAVSVGAIYPAMVVAAWGDQPDSYVNLKVMLDGPDTYWATSRKVGDEPGTYHWMAYQKGQAAKTEELEGRIANALV